MEKSGSINIDSLEYILDLLIRLIFREELLHFAEKTFQFSFFLQTPRCIMICWKFPSEKEPATLSFIHMIRSGMNEYFAQYENLFVRNLKRYASLRERIKRCAERILNDPSTQTELLGACSAAAEPTC